MNHFVGSSDLILSMNAQLLDWLGAGYFLNLFAIGIAIWLIRLLISLSLGSLGEQNTNKAFMNMVLGGVLCAMIITPIHRFPYLNQLLNLEEGQYATPASGLVKRILGDSSDYFTFLFVSKVFTPELTTDPEPSDELSQKFLQSVVKWLAMFTGMDLVGVDTDLSLAQATGQVREDAEGNEGGVLAGVGNFFDGLKGTYDMSLQAGLIVREFLVSPLTAISYFCGVFLILIVGLWINLISFAFPFLFCALLFILPISYIFDGMGRVMPLVKWLVAFAISKPLAMMFVTLGFGLIDDYFLSLFNQGNIEYHHPTIYQDGFFELVVAVPYSLPLVLSIGLASAILALFSPVIGFLVLGAEGGMLAGMVAGAYMQVASMAASIATKGAGILTNGVTGAGELGVEGGVGGGSGGSPGSIGGLTQGVGNTENPSMPKGGQSNEKDQQTPEPMGPGQPTQPPVPTVEDFDSEMGPLPYGTDPNEAEIDTGQFEAPRE